MIHKKKISNQAPVPGPVAIPQDIYAREILANEPDCANLLARDGWTAREARLLVENRRQLRKAGLPVIYAYCYHPYLPNFGQNYKHVHRKEP